MLYLKDTNVFTKLWLTIVAFSVWFFSSYSAYNQQIPFASCDLKFDTSNCFNSDQTINLSFGEHVTSLDEAFRFCLDTTTSAAYQPIKVIIAIDKSGSMCSGTNTSDASDPNDQRIIAAHKFIDSLKIKSPLSYVGLIIFTNVITYSYSPVQLSNATGLSGLHSAVERGACNANPNRLYKAMDTYQGTALDSAFGMLEKINSSTPSNYKQHIILLTDDGWFVNRDLTPDQVLTKHRPKFPAGEFPKVHSVILTQTGELQTGGETGIQNLKSIADSTGGLFIDDATPASIVDKFMTILSKMSVQRDKLTNVVVQNLSTGEKHVMKLDSVKGVKNDFVAVGSSWTLKDGVNLFTIQKTYALKDGTSDVFTDTLKITRDPGAISDVITNNGQLSCDSDMVGVSFTADPQSVKPDDKISAKVQIDPAYSLPYSLSNIQVRAFTASDANVGSLLALYHLDSTTVDASNAKKNGNGSPDFSTGGAFKSCMSNGSFTTQINIPTGDFSFDFWVNRSNNANGQILSSDGISVSINDNGFVVVKSGSVTLTSNRSVFSDVWSNVAIARSKGKIAIFVNGIKVSSDMTIGVSGNQNFSVTAKSNLKIDEIRFNSISRVVSNDYTSTYDIPLSSSILWNIQNKDVSGNAPAVPAAAWAGSSLNFSLSSSFDCGIILNLVKYGSHCNWSVNSNSLTVFTPIGAVPVDAELFDQNGNGFIDSICINLPDSSSLINPLPSVDKIFNQVVLETYEGTVNLSPKNIFAINAHRFGITLNENSGSTYETGWKSANIAFKSVILTVTGAQLTTNRVIDRAGPVIANALYDGKKDPDLLIITFSEPVNWKRSGGSQPKDVYNYYQKANLTSSAFDNIFSFDMVSSSDKLEATISMTNKFVIIPFIDSIQLKAVTNEVTDLSDNPANAESRRAVIEGNIEPLVDIIPTQNPYKQGAQITDQRIFTIYPNVLKGESNVLLVAIHTNIPLLEKSDKTCGFADIYDAVGNIVVRNLPVYKGNDHSDTEYGLKWKGKNSNNRDVAAGTYLAVVSMVMNDGKNSSYQKRIKIGISR